MSASVTFATRTATVRDSCPGCDDNWSTTSSAETAARGGANGSAHDDREIATRPMRTAKRIFTNDVSGEKIEWFTRRRGAEAGKP
jgi:hypothetical protein